VQFLVELLPSGGEGDLVERLQQACRGQDAELRVHIRPFRKIAHQGLENLSEAVAAPCPPRR
jgi:hypothetical protein